MTSFMIDPDLDAGLKAVKQQFGIPEAEQIRRAIRKWLAEFPAGHLTQLASVRRKTTKKRR
jgi:hypothetical protein